MESVYAEVFIAHDIGSAAAGGLRIDFENAFGQAAVDETLE
jgi:hypothetical protein